MSLNNSPKSSFSDVFIFFSDNAKKNLPKIIVIFAVFAVFNFALANAVNRYMPFADSFLYTVIYFLLQLSFMSAVLPLLSGKSFTVKRLVPGLKYILFSLVLCGVLLFFLLIVRSMLDLLLNFVLINVPFIPVIFRIFYGFIAAVSILFMLFSIFDFQIRPAIDLPLLNARDVLKSNILFISLIALVIALMYLSLPFLKEGVFSFAFRMFFGICLMTVYLSLRSKEQLLPDATSVSEPEPMRAPKIKINN